MADCHYLFTEFNNRIKLGDPARDILLGTRDSLRTHIKDEFAIKYPDYVPIFQTQGSFVMDTIIRPLSDDFDLDDGTYFNMRQSDGKVPKAEDVRSWISSVIGDKGNVVDKPACIRVEFEKEGFHIDLPIYHADNFKEPFLAHKNDGWIESGPVEFIEWFEMKIESGFQKAFLYEGMGLEKEYNTWLSDIRKADSQLRKIVRYLKAWGDTKREEMPPGIVMTILAAENYQENKKDDVALRDTLVKIRKYLDDNGFKCIRPTRKDGEDLFESSTQEEKNYFSKAIDSFILSANQAVKLDGDMHKEACAKWQKHLGKRFPCEIILEDLDIKTYAKPAIIGDTHRSA